MAEHTRLQGKTERERFCTYRVFDPDIQKFIYVGMTSNLPSRIQHHKSKSQWWKDTLLFSTINEGMERKKASKDEKRWIQRYAEEGHPLENRKHNVDALFLRKQREGTRQWLSDHLKDSSLSPEEKEEAILLYIRGREEYEMMWAMAEDMVYRIAESLEETHQIDLNFLEITRLMAKAVGLNIDDEGTK